MSQAEKLMHELSQNCGIDFNNTRRKLSVEIIDKYLREAGKVFEIPDEAVITMDPARVDVSDPSIPLTGVPSVAEAITSAEAFASQEPVINNTQESLNATGS